MASVDDALLIASFEEHLKELSDTVIEGNVILAMLDKTPGAIRRRQGGTKIDFPIVKEDDPSVDSFSFYDQLQVDAHNPFAQGTLEWSGYHGGVVLSLWERWLNEYSPSQIFSLFDEKVRNFKKTYRSNVGVDLYADGTGNANKDVDGLEAFVKATGTYAGQSQTTTWWGANNRAVTTSFATDSDSDGISNGIETMGLMWMDCSHGAGGLVRKGNSNLPKTNDTPNLIVTTQSGWLNYESELLPQQRYADKRMANLGFDSLLYRQTPVTWDRNCTADTMYFLNTNYLELRVVKDEIINVDVTEKTRSPHAYVYTAVGIFQFMTRNPRYLGKVTNVD